MDTPVFLTSLQRSAIPPGRSLTVTENFTNLPSTASPRSKHLPRIVVSMLPQHKGITTLKKWHIISILIFYSRFKFNRNTEEV